MARKENLMPLARTTELEVQLLDNEALVYDLKRHRAHCLNKTAALVWHKCDGQTSLEEMASILEGELGSPVDEELVRLILARLEKAHLVQKKSGSRPASTGYSRREFVEKMKKLGLVASVMLPLVTSIVSPIPAQAQTCVPRNACWGAADCTPCGNCTTEVCCNFFGRRCIPIWLANWIGCC